MFDWSELRAAGTDTGPGAQLVGMDELAELRDVIETQRLGRYGSTPGKVEQLEHAIDAMTGMRSVATNGGTSALWIALRCLDLQPGDEVIVPGFTFVATMSAVTFAGGVPVLAEVDTSLALDPDDVERRITRRTRAIVVVHMLGYPARLDRLLDVAFRHDIPLIEDAAQAFGATYHGKPVGSFGWASAYSFNMHKTITCGDGGLVSLANMETYERAFALHDQGHAPLRSNASMVDDPLPGLNFRMTELQGAVMLAQLRRLPVIHQRLLMCRSILDAALDVETVESGDPSGDLNTHYVLMLPTARLARDFAARIDSITLDQSGWHVYHRMSHFGYQRGMLPQTDDVLARSISFGLGVTDPNLAPVGVRMDDSKAAVSAIAEALANVVREVLA